jgi:formylglycine-generating enzyme required for sulfatase activity
MRIRQGFFGLLAAFAATAGSSGLAAGQDASTSSGATGPTAATPQSPAAMDAGTPQAAKPSANVVASIGTSPTAGTVKEFQDLANGPVMVVVQAGQFDMGSPSTEAGRDSFEDMQHRVVIGRDFALAKYDVTFEQWDACVADGGCSGYRPDDEGWGRGSQPVMNVSFDDAQAYVQWLAARTGKRYRLPSEAEWEYAARAGTSTPYWWGDAASHDSANYGSDVCCSGLAVGADRWTATSPVGSFPPNAFGLYDMNGNVMQLVADCWHSNYRGAPPDGSIWESSYGSCGMRTARGGSWSSPPAFIRAADRIWLPPTTRTDFMGFRVARDMQ